MNHYNHSPWDACILITSSNPDNRRFGTGFIVSHFEQKSFIMTCAHVVNSVGEDSVAADGRPAKIVCLGSADGLDLAVITTDEFVGKSIIRLAVSEGAGHPFFTAGFRQYGPHHRIIVSLEGRVLEQVGLPQSKFHAERINAWILAIDQGKRLYDGYSGSPVVDYETNLCLGIICFMGDESGTTGLAISIEELEKLWLGMPISIERNRELQSSYQERLYRQANQSLIKGDLSRASDLYENIRALNPSYPGINRRLQSVQDEMQRSYVDRYGIVNGEQVVTTIKRENIPKPKPPPPPKRKSPNLLMQTVRIYVVIIVVFYTIIALSVAMFYLTGISLISSPFYPLPPDVERLTTE